MPLLTNRPIHLSRDGAASSEPPFDDPAWFDAYDVRHGGDIAGARLVTQFRFTESWASWELHPKGDEIVLCTEGTITLLQQSANGHEERITLCAGEYALNPQGVWHTADIAPGAVASCVFITPGEGTEHRQR
jgi:quercetin dioxygenase-like cupin family protein